MSTFKKCKILSWSHCTDGQARRIITWTEPEIKSVRQLKQFLIWAFQILKRIHKILSVLIQNRTLNRVFKTKKKLLFSLILNNINNRTHFHRISITINSEFIIKVQCFFWKFYTLCKNDCIVLYCAIFCPSNMIFCRRGIYAYISNKIGL